MIIKSNLLKDVKSDDLELIKDIDRKYFPFPWKDSNWTDSIKNSNYLIFYDPSCRGFAIYLLSPLEKLAHLLKVVISPDFRKMGIAASILNASYSHLRILGIERCILEVEVSNTRAISLYLRQGYSKIHLQKKFYSNGADAHIMEKHL